MNYFIYTSHNNKNNEHLMTGPKGNSEFCFPETSMFPEAKLDISVSFLMYYTDSS